MSDATKLGCLLYFNGADEATSFTDDSINALSIANNDTARAKLDTATKKFGSASCEMTLGSSYSAIDFTHEGITKFTTTTRIYGANIPIGTEIYNQTRNEYSYVTNVVYDSITAGVPETTAYEYYIDISPAISGQDASDTIYYAGTDVVIPNTSNAVDLNNDFAISMWIRKGTCAGTFIDTGEFKLKIETDETIKAYALTTEILASTDTISTSAFNWVVFARSGDRLALYIDGVKQDESIGSYDNLTVNIQLGNYVSGAGAGFAGWIDEVQIWDGIPLINSSFPETIEVPTAEYADDEDVEVINLNLQTEITADDVEVASLNLDVEVTANDVEVVNLNLDIEIAEFPLLTTNPATNVDATTVTMNGTFYSGISAVVEMGFVYSTSANPTTADTKEVISTDSGDLSANVIGLSSGTTYYYRAFLTDGVDTYYGDDEEFTTEAVVVGVPQTTATIFICDFVGTESAETGTVENEIDLTAHSYNVDDFAVNTTQDNTSRRIISTTSDSVVVASISGQTVGDEIRFYQFTDHTDLLKDSTLNVNKKIQEDTEANFTLICDPTYLPRAGQYVKINTNGQHVFTGFIRSANRRLPQNGIDTKIFVDCECITLNAIPPRRTVTIAYDIDTTASTIVAQMVDSFLVSDGVASGTIDDGVVLPDDWYDDALSIGDILDALADQSGYQWMIDKNFKLQFYQDPTTVSTYSATISDLTTSTFTDFRNVTINETIDDYNNKAFYVGGTDDYGNLIIVSQETTASILEVQDYAGGSGVYGNVVRDSALTHHEFFTATAGTTESTISASGLGDAVDVGDMLYNLDGYERRNVLAIDGDSVTVAEVSGQTQGQVIATYEQINDVVDNHLKRQDQVHRRLEFDTFTTDFEAGQKLEVVLSKLSVTTTETYVINEVDIQDRGANYFVAHVVADKRNPDNFSTQRNPNYKDYYRQF